MQRIPGGADAGIRVNCVAPGRIDTTTLTTNSIGPIHRIRRSARRMILRGAQNSSHPRAAISSREPTNTTPQTFGERPVMGICTSSFTRS